MPFKVGDRVRVTTENYYTDEANDGVGTIVSPSYGERGDWKVAIDGGQELGYLESELSPIVKTLENLEVGDVIVDGEGEETILAVLAPGFYCMSRRDNPRGYSWTATAFTLERDGWSVKQAEPVQPREITMAEIEAKFGEPVVIKKEG